MLLAIAVAALVVSVVTLCVLTAALRALEAATPPRVPLPPLTVIRPVRGLDPGLEDNARHALRARYPAPVETIFVLDDETDPAFPVLERVVATERANARIVLAGSPPERCTGKLHAMIRGLEAASARTPLVCFSDSDTRPPPGVLEDLASIVAASSDVGAAFARVIGTSTPRTAGDAGYALLLDGLYGPQAALAGAIRSTLPFVMGQTMVLRRSALDACGGLEGSVGEVVDDMHIGVRLAAAGYRNVIASTPVAIVQEGLDFASFRRIALRWMVFGRTGIPSKWFNAPTTVWIATYFVGLVGALVALARGDLAALVAFAAALVSVPVSLELLRRQQGGAALPLSLWWVPFVCLALVPVWFLAARYARTIEWRGRRYALEPGGRLEVPAPQPSFS